MCWKLCMCLLLLLLLLCSRWTPYTPSVASIMAQVLSIPSVGAAETFMHTQSQRRISDPCLFLFCLFLCSRVAFLSRSFFSPFSFWSRITNVTYFLAKRESSKRWRVVWDHTIDIPDQVYFFFFLIIISGRSWYSSTFLFVLVINKHLNKPFYKRVCI